MRKLLVIVGPTASGKTKLALDLAKKNGGELVSCDSRQVYRGMDIGTGKDIPENSKFRINPTLRVQNSELNYWEMPENVRLWGVDLVEPWQQFSVAHYVELAEKVIADIYKRGKLPILVGGTGFYIKAIVDGIETIGIPPNQVVRAAYARKTADELFEVLLNLNPELASSLNPSERKNKQRLIRRIEIEQSKFKCKPKSKKKDYDAFFVGLNSNRSNLYKRIDKRVDQRLKQGLVEEVRNLLKRDVDHERLQKFGLEYRSVSDHLQGKTTREEMVQKLKYEIHGFARRQLTWFRRDRRIIWFDVSRRGWKRNVEKLVRNWYDKEKSKIKT